MTTHNERFEWLRRNGRLHIKPRWPSVPNGEQVALFFGNGSYAFRGFGDTVEGAVNCAYCTVEESLKKEFFNINQRTIKKLLIGRDVKYTRGMH